MPNPCLIVGARVRSFGRAASVRGDVAANAVLCGADGRIITIGRADAIRAPGAEIVELPGATLTPGLTDAHIHLTEWALSRRQVDLADAASPEDAARHVAAHAGLRAVSGSGGDQEVVAGAGHGARAGSMAARRAVGIGVPDDRHGAADAVAWVRGRGWSRERWAGAEPDRHTLDAWLPDTPVVLQSHDMHALWVNSAALRRAGIGADTPDPPDGRIIRDADGEPTGVLLEAAGQLVIRHIPAPTDAEMLDAVLDAQASLHSLGITGVHSLPGIAVPRPDPLPVLERLRADGRLRLRVLQHLPVAFLDDAIRLGLRSGFGGDWIRIGGIKMFLDGSLGSRTAWMREPYEGVSVPGSGEERSGPGYGVNVLPEPEFRYAVRRAAEAGLASAVHAIGDSAVALAIDVLADPAVRVEAMPHRIEHVQCLPSARQNREPRAAKPTEVGEGAGSRRVGSPPGTEGGGVDRGRRRGRAGQSGEPTGNGELEAVARAGVICSVQPAHLITDWRAVDRHWGRSRGARTYAFRSLLDAGAVLACGSDAPVEPVDPRLGLFAAIARTDLDGSPDGGWHPAQRIGIEDAFRAYTLGPAVAAARSGEEGELIPGAFADIVAWDTDPLGDGVDPLALSCVATIVGGEPVYMRSVESRTR